jgi:ribosomal-protein-alanine N-acetyltransferase
LKAGAKGVEQREDEAIPYVIRPMQLDDLDDVLAIEQASFANPWPPSAFRYDLSRPEYAHYIVLAPRRPLAEQPAPSRSLIQRLWRREPERPPALLGYAGFWLLVDEAHICNIAVAPAWRGRGLGELLLLSLIDAAAERGMSIVTLEVRISNDVAQRLYRKYGFEIVGRRKHYYSDNGEDALIMSTGVITSSAYQRNLAELRYKLFERLRRNGERLASGA